MHRGATLRRDGEMQRVAGAEPKRMLIDKPSSRPEPPARLSGRACKRRNASGISVKGAPLRKAPGLRWITAR